MNKQDEGRLRDMLEMSRKVRSYVQDKTRVMLDSDEFLLFGLVKAIEIIGEAASQVSKELREAVPEIPWPIIIGMRNRLVHGYDQIDLKILWKTVQEDLPTLITTLEQVLNQG